MLDSDSAEIIHQLRGLPHLVSRIVGETSPSHLFFLTGPGDIYEADLIQNRIEGPVASIPGATSLATNAAGTKLYLVGPQLASVVWPDITDAYSHTIAPLPGSPYWICADPNGPFLLAGSARDTQVTVVHAESLHVVEQLDFAKPAD